MSADKDERTAAALRMEAAATSAAKEAKLAGQRALAAREVIQNVADQCARAGVPDDVVRVLRDITDPSPTWVKGECPPPSVVIDRSFKTPEPECLARLSPLEIRPGVTWGELSVDAVKASKDRDTCLHRSSRGFPARKKQTQGLSNGWIRAGPNGRTSERGPCEHDDEGETGALVQGAA